MSASSLLQALQIGVARANPDSNLPAPLRTLLQATPSASGSEPGAAAERIWLAFGALDLWERAGLIAPAAPPPVEPSAQEAMPPCPAAALRLLPLMFRGEFAGLLPEWLGLAQRHGYRLPPRFLQQLLDIGANRPDLRAPIAAVLGERGAWLAARNPEWNWALHSMLDATALFDNGTLEQRVRALHDLRARDPAAGLHALRGCWSAEAPEARAALLSCLETGLSADDESFLEAALDDRRKAVRTVAQQLLAILPGSSLAARALVRADALGLLKLERSAAGVATLVVTLPEKLDKAAERDGVGASPHARLGEKAGWLVDLLATVPPHHWSDLWQMRPQRCLQLAAGTEFEHAILAGWSTATMRCPGQAGAALIEWSEWFQALAWRLAAGRSALASHYPTGFCGAAVHLPAQQLERFLSELVAKARHETSPDMGAIVLLKDMAQAAPAPWSEALSAQLVALVRTCVLAWGARGYHFEFISALPLFAAVIDPCAVDEAGQGWPLDPAVWEHWEKPIGEFLRTLRFRQDMTLSFQEQSI